MIRLYMFCLVLGAFLLAPMVFFDATHPSETAEQTPAPRSAKFWTFFIPAFGIVGIILDGLDLTAPTIAATLAAACGVLFGVAVPRITQRLIDRAQP